MKDAFTALLEEFGQSVVCCDRDGTVTGEEKAFLQPVTEKKWQSTAWALGSVRTDRFLCIAPAELPLGAPGDGGWLRCGGVRYQTIAVHEIPLGDEISHQWAVLERRMEDAV